MKTSIFTAILSIIVAMPIFAQSQSHTMDEIMAKAKGLPALSNVALKFKPAPKFASVQPTADIKFSYSSCAPRVFKLKQIETKDRIFALISQTLKAECFGPSVSRKYKLPIASDIIRKPVVVLNPVGYDFKPSPIGIVIPPHRMCTKIAGVLTHKITGLKTPFTDGCQKAHLIATGDYE